MYGEYDDNLTEDQRMHRRPHAPPPLAKDQEWVYCEVMLEGFRFIAKCEFRPPKGDTYPGYLDVFGLYLESDKYLTVNFACLFNDRTLAKADNLAWKKLTAGNYWDQKEQDIPV